MYGVMDESFFHLRYPRTVDVVCDTLTEAFAEAQDMLERGVEKVAICSVRNEADKKGFYYEKDTLFVLESTEAWARFEEVNREKG